MGRSGKMQRMLDQAWAIALEGKQVRVECVSQEQADRLAVEYPNVNLHFVYTPYVPTPPPPKPLTIYDEAGHVMDAEHYKLICTFPPWKEREK